MSRSPDTSGNVDREIDIGVLITALVRAWPILFLLPFIVGGVVFAITSVITPTYQAESVLLIEVRESNLARGDGQGAADLTSTVLDDQSIKSQVEVLRSVEIASRVIERLGLEDNGEYGGVNGSGFSLSALLFGADSERAARSRRQRTLEAFEERLTVYNVPGSRVLGIRTVSENPVTAADVANTVASAYLEFQSQAKQGVTGEAAAYLEQEVESLRKKVAEAEQKVAEFRSRSDLFVGAENRTLSDQQLSELNSQLVQAEADAAQENARAARLKSLLNSGQSIDSIPEISADPFIQVMREREATLKAQIAERSTTLLSSHPIMQALQGQLSDVRVQINEGAREALASLDKNAQIANDRVRNLRARLNELKAGVAENAGADVQLRGLEREAEAQRALLETYLARYREALSRQGGNYSPPDARVIARASPPIKPSFPNVPLFSAAAAVATLLFVAVIVILRALLSGVAIRSQQHDDDFARQDAGLTGDAIPDPESTTFPEQNQSNKPISETKDQPLSRMIEQSADLDHAPEFHMSDHNIDQKNTSAENEIDYFTGQKLRMRAYDFLPYSRRQHLVRPSKVVGVNDYTKLIAANAGHTDPVHLIYAVSDPSDSALYSLAFARRVAELGTRSIVVDLGLTDEPSNILGLSDVILGDAEISQAIHRDRESLAHLMACGRQKLDYRDDDNLASLLKMLKALSGVYPVTYVNAGAAQDTLDLLGPVMTSGGHPTFIVSPDIEGEIIEEIRSAFDGTGIGKPSFVDSSIDGEDEKGQAPSSQSAA